MNPLMKRALADAVRKLAPKAQAANPVMFMVYLSALLTSVLLVLSWFGIADAPSGYIAAICAVLWATVLFGNFAEALAEGRGKAQADSLRAAKRDVEALVLAERDLAAAAAVEGEAQGALLQTAAQSVSSSTLAKGQLYLVMAGEQVPADGEIVLGAASVDESAITGESAPVVRESGGDRSSLTGGTTVLSDWLVARVTAEAGHSFLDQMIAMVESSARAKTPNERALELLLIALTLVFLAVSWTLYGFGAFSASTRGAANPLGLTSLVALFVCLAPTTIGALLSAIGIAGMSRLNEANVLATSGRAVEAAGDVDVLLLDKTGTITLGNRQAAA
ncbi:MAG: HAD-IC family P-type ATPase, partial [Adlercreutzia sp.]|nr:HAD-IC family P-type ATPase [Adlercreutzia sp.]